MTTTIDQIETYLEDRVVEPVEKFFSSETPVLKNALSSAEDLIKQSGGDALAKIAADCVPLIATMQWSAVTAKLIADATAAGLTLVAGLEQLVASTVLQLAQAADASVNPNATTAASNPVEGSTIEPATPAS